MDSNRSYSKSDDSIIEDTRLVGDVGNRLNTKSANMFDLAVLLSSCGNDEVDPDEGLICFVDDINVNTGEITSVKVLL